MEAQQENIFTPLKKYIETFAKITNDDWLLLLPHLEVKLMNKGDYFIKEGKKETKIGFVIDGTFRQFYTKEGEEKTTYFYFENHFISAYISCLTGKPSLVTIEALSSATIVFFPYQAMLSLFEQSMAWQKFGRLIAEYLTIGLEERMVSLLLQSPEERYVDLLNSKKQKILEKIPQHFIANYLGITPVSMSRIRNRLIKK